MNELRESPIKCIVVLVGIPGSGKTKFCEKYSTFSEQKQINCLHICYDQLISLDRQKDMVHEHGSWKLERAKIVEAVERLINNTSPETYDENPYFKVIESKNKSKIDQKKSSSVILIDDNNYLQSMRYEYYQLARKYSIGFSQLYFDCSTEVAKKLNNSRSAENQVPEDVITKMTEKLEQPNPFNNKWEAFSFIVKVDVDNNIEDSFDMIHTVIEAAIDNPAQEIVPNVSEEEREKDRVACDASVIHQADKCLRSFVNKRMFAMKQSGLGKDEMNAASKRIYKVKSEVLEDLKTGYTKLDKNLVTSIQNRDPDSSRMLENDLNSIFQEKLALQ